MSDMWTIFNPWSESGKLSSTNLYSLTSNNFGSIKTEYIKKEIVINDIKQARKLSKFNDLLYVDTNGKLCCTETLDSAINLVKYNDKKEID